MNKEISLEHSQEILVEMCKGIGMNVSDVDFTLPNWFQTHTWTGEQEESFRIWLGKFLVDHKYAKKGKYRGQNAGYYEAGKIIFNYGWKLK